jgi:hypothetical protein
VFRKSKDFIERPHIHIFSSPGVKLPSLGSDSLLTTLLELIRVRLRVSPIMLAKAMVITHIIAIESSPPVKVLYWV